MDAAAELGSNPVSKRQIQPEYGDEEADARRDRRNHLARLHSQARTGIGMFESLGLFVETSKSRPTRARLRNRELADEAELVSLSVG